MREWETQHASPAIAATPRFWIKRLGCPFWGRGSRVMRLGPQPINWSVQCYGNAVHSQGGSPSSFKFQVALLYPKAREKK
jgi:hypothetical protein